jgi:hypothetical protein
MVNKTVYALNIALVLFWTLSLFSLWRQVSYHDSKNIVDHRAELASVQKSSKTWAFDKRSFFNTKPVEDKPISADSKPDDSALNEKGFADVTLRVQGIFTTRSRRFAVIESISKKSSKIETVRVSVGDVIADTTVSRIQSDIVTLNHQASGETIVLKIFKPVEGAPKR